MRPKQRFKAYEYDQYVMEGTAEEVADYFDMTVSGVWFIADQKGTHRLEFRKQNIYLDAHEVDVMKIKTLMLNTGHSTKDLGEILNYHRGTVAAKLRGDKRFNLADLDELEDLFFLEEGELFND